MLGEARAIKLMWSVLPLVALVGALVWWPLHRDNQAIGRRIEQTTQQLADARRSVQRYNRLSKQADRMRDRLDDYRQNIPDGPRLTELFASLTGAIERLGLRDSDLSSGSIVARPGVPGVRAMPIRLTFQGDAVAAFDLLRRIESMPRLVQPTKLMMQASGDAADSVRVELQLQAFFQDAGEAGP